MKVEKKTTKQKIKKGNVTVRVAKSGSKLPGKILKFVPPNESLSKVCESLGKGHRNAIARERFTDRYMDKVSFGRYIVHVNNYTYKYIVASSNRLT